MDERMGKAIVRVGKELSESLLTGYSKDYAVGLGVSLIILWECANDKKSGEGQNLAVHEILTWVRDLQINRNFVPGEVIQ